MTTKQWDNVFRLRPVIGLLRIKQFDLVNADGHIKFDVARTMAGVSPVREFLDELKVGNPGDFGIVLRGLAKPRNRISPRAFVQSAPRRVV